MVRRLFSKFIFIVSLAGLLSSCATSGVQMKDINQPVKLLQSAIYNALPNGKPKVDKTKRRFVSQPYLVKGGLFIPISNSRIYYVSNVEILGDRRPYTIYIESLRMIRDGNQFAVSGKDKVLSQTVANAIQKELTKRLKNTDIIDDFRVF